MAQSQGSRIKAVRNWGDRRSEVCWTSLDRDKIHWPSPMPQNKQEGRHAVLAQNQAERNPLSLILDGSREWMQQDKTQHVSDIIKPSEKQRDCFQIFQVL